MFERRAKCGLYLQTLGALLLLLLAGTAYAERMCSDTSSSADTGTLTDSGGSGSNYSNSERCTFRITSAGDITLSFSSFSYESGYDYLYVFDGPDTSSPRLGRFSGSSPPGDLTATSGTMTIVHVSDFSITRSGFVANWSAGGGSGCGSETVADSFPSLSYANSTGSVPWSTDWLEIGESDGPSAGQSRVSDRLCDAGYCLRIGEPFVSRSWSNRGAERGVDLSDAASATLSFVYLTGYATGTQTVTLDVSDDGGSSWTTLRSWSINSTNTSPVSQSFDISAFASADTRIRFLSSGINARIGLYVDNINISYQPSCTPTAVAEWRFDESGWSAAAGEVVDSQATAFNGTAINGADTTNDGYLCGAARFDGVDDYLEITGIDNTLRDTASLSFWMRTRQSGNDVNWRAPGLAGAELSGGVDDIFWGWLDASGRVGINVGDVRFSQSSGPINDGAWRHVVLTRDAASGELVTYVNGTVQSTVSSVSGTIGTGFSSLGRIEDTGGSPAYFAGDLDEVVMFDRVLNLSEVQSIYDNQRNGNNWDGSVRTCPIIGATALEVTHDGAGLYCAAETVVVRAVDVNGALVSSYTETISLDTGTGSGNWSLLTGSGTLLNGIADDGVATYAFDPADGGSATFSLSYTSGPAAVDIDAIQQSDASVTDDDSEGTLLFSPTGITVTAHALSNPPPSPINDPVVAQTAGVPFELHLTLFGGDPEDATCGVIEDVNETRSVGFWQSWENPASGSIRATVDGLQVGAGAGTAVPVNVDFVQGQAVVSAKYKDVGAIRLYATEAASGAAGSSNAFVVKPAALVTTLIEDAAGNANPGATTATGPRFVAAGASFVVQVQARDAEDSITPNFGLELAPESVAVSSASLVVPVGGRNGSSGVGTLINGDQFALTATPGVLRNATVSFDEVGVIRLAAQIEDGDYLGAGNVSTLTGEVGRFHVDEFALVNASVTPACGSFTYMAQDTLAVSYTLHAVNALGDRVYNYDETLLGAAQMAAVSLVAENLNDGIDLGGRLSISSSSWQQGIYALSVTDGVFARAGVLDGPYEAVALGVTVADALDNRLLSGMDMHATASGDCLALGDCSAATVGNSAFYYGRFMVYATQGPEALDLDVPVAAQIWNGESFVINSADSCTDYAVADISLDAFTDNLTAGETLPVAPVTSTQLLNGFAAPGQFPVLSAPGTGNEGSVRVSFDVDAWLEFDWAGDGLTTQDPAGVALFGRYRGNDRIVFWREKTRE